MLAKLWMSFAINRTIIEIIPETMIVISHACRGIYMNITQALVTGFSEHISLTLFDKTDPLDPLKREDC